MRITRNGEFLDFGIVIGLKEKQCVVKFSWRKLYHIVGKKCQ